MIMEGLGSFFFNEVLWFGLILDHSLINPNEIRMMGMPLSDDPLDEIQKLGIFHKRVLIPFKTDGNTVHFN